MTRNCKSDQDQSSKTIGKLRKHPDLEEETIESETANTIKIKILVLRRRESRELPWKIRSGERSWERSIEERNLIGSAKKWWNPRGASGPLYRLECRLESSVFTTERPRRVVFGAAWIPSRAKTAFPPVDRAFHAHALLTVDAPHARASYPSANVQII